MKAFVIVLFLLPSVSAFSQNQLKNFSFEETDSWNLWGGEQVKGGRIDNFSLKITNKEAKWAGADQSVQLPAGTKTVKVSGWMKTENVVQGSNPWELARLTVEFYASGGDLAGGYPPVTGQVSGTSDWTFYERSYTVPDGASVVKFQMALGNATGAAWFDDVEVLLQSADGEFLHAVIPSGPADEGNWYPVEVHPEKTAGHYVDWSGLLDAPAGKHGFIKASGDMLVFQDGTPSKFWGTNLVAADCFPDKKTADSLAHRLAKMGCNLVRLHHMDAPWSKPNIFGNSSSSRKLSAESMERLDYLIYALEKRGIYIFMDLLVHRDFTAEDGVSHPLPDLGGKQVGYFNKTTIELQKEYAGQLLNHINPYTEKAYKNDAGIVASEFINESSAFLHFGGDILDEHYREELDSIFAMEYPGRKRAVFDLEYGAGVAPRVKMRSSSTGDLRETIQFLSSLERRYYSGMYSHLRGMGVKYLLSGSNFPIPLLRYQHDNSDLDLVLSNEYWDHPQIWKMNNDWSRILYAPVDNRSMIRNPNKAIPAAVSKFIWENKPFMVTEYNFCSPNEFRLEGAPLVAAYSSLQGIDGMLQFDFGSGAPGSERANSFSLARDPDQLAQWVIAAPMYLRQDVKEAPGLALDHISVEELNSLPLYSDFLEKNFHLPYITRTAKTTQKGNEDNKKYDSFFDEKNKVITSETGELKLEYGEAVFSINTPRIQGAQGALKDKVLDFPLFSAELNNSWASVMAVSADDQPLIEADTFYLVVTTPVKMQGQKMNEARTRLVETGDIPVLAQIAEGSVQFKLGAKQIRIYPINIIGERNKPEVLKQKKGFSLDLSAGRTFVYEVVVIRE